MLNPMNDEPELRRDPITGRGGLIAPDSVRRPIPLFGAGPRHRTADERTPCPYCAGEEHDTPGEVFAVRDPATTPNGPGWRLRVVPNKLPAVRRNASAPAPVGTPGPMSGRILDEDGEG